VSLRPAGPGDLGRWASCRSTIRRAKRRLALARCFADPRVSTVLVDPLASNTRTRRFYERLGFRFVERWRFGQDDCFVYRLDRVDARR
jgi:RimJ/RimL family protein N-acetyltransferase